MYSRFLELFESGTQIDIFGYGLAAKSQGYLQYLPVDMVLKLYSNMLIVYIFD